MNAYLQYCVCILWCSLSPATVFVFHVAALAAIKSVPCEPCVPCVMCATRAIGELCDL